MRRSTFVALLVALLVASSAIAPAALAETSLEYGDERADLDITQPTFIDGAPERETTDNRTKYRVQGPTQRIRLIGESHENVTNAGVLDGSGSLSYDSAADAWTFDAEGEAGTRVVFFDVKRTHVETVERQEGNETVTDEVKSTETVRLAATLVVSNVEWAHRPAAQDKEMRSDAQNWSSVESDAKRLSDGPAQETIADAFEVAKFASSPFASFQADAAGTLAMATRPGGLAVFGGMFLTFSVILAGTIRLLHKREKQLEHVGDVEKARDGAYLEQARKILSERDYNEYLPDHLARFMRDYFGRNVYLGAKEYARFRSTTHTKALVLQLMAQVGYSGRVRFDDAGDVLFASVVRDGDRDDLETDGGTETETVDLAKLAPDAETDRAFIDAVPGSDLDTNVLYEPDRLDLDAVAWPIDKRDVGDGELVDELNPDIPGDVDDEETLAECLSGMFHLVANHPHTTDDGRTRKERDLLSFLSELDSILSDEVDFPLAHVQRRVTLLAAERMDSADDLRDDIDRLETDGLDLADEVDGDDGDDIRPPGAFNNETDDVQDDDTDTVPDDGTVPFAEIAERAGYDIDDEDDISRLYGEANLTADMSDDEISERLVAHFSKDLDTDDLLDLTGGLGGGGE